MIGYQYSMKGSRSYNLKFLLATFLVLAGVLLCADAFAMNCSNAPNIPLDPTQPIGPGNQMDPDPSSVHPGDPYYDPAGPTYQILHRFVGCMEDNIYRLGLLSFTTFRLAVQNTVEATIVLFVAIFFTKAMLKAFRQSEAAEFGALTLKLAAVGFFVLGTGVEMFMPAFYRGLQWFTEVVTSAAPGAAVCNVARLWLRIDCNISYMLASAPGMVVDGAPWVLLAVGVQALFTIGGGPLLLGLVLILFVLMLAAFATAVLAYVMCLIALMILLMISPLVIPLYLFTFTQGIFQIWFRLLFGYMLQPMLLFGYLAFMMQVISIIVFGPPGAGPNSVLGLVPIMQDLYGSMIGGDSHRPVVTGQTRVETGAGPPPADPAHHRSTEVEGWSFVVTNLTFTGGSASAPCAAFSGNDYKVCRVQHLNINLIALIVTFALTFSFMSTVMERASELVGAGASASFMKSINIYAQTVQYMQAIAKDVTTAVASGGSDLSFKSTVSQVARTVKDQAGG
jgi:hypothetical protein